MAACQFFFCLVDLEPPRPTASAFQAGGMTGTHDHAQLLVEVGACKLLVHGWPQSDLLTSASQVPRSTGVSHWHLANSHLKNIDI
jgi:hypothetical protein